MQAADRADEKAPLQLPQVQNLNHGRIESGRNYICLQRGPTVDQRQHSQ